jgi:hypothetical protein
VTFMEKTSSNYCPLYTRQWSTSDFESNDGAALNDLNPCSISLL